MIIELWLTLKVGIRSRCRGSIAAWGLVLTLIGSPLNSFLPLLTHSVYARLWDAILETTFTWAVFVATLAGIRTVSALI